MSAKKLFISHSSVDVALVKDFVDLLEGGIGVRANEIFCSSLRGQGIKPGSDFKQSVREHLGDATCVIVLVTPNFYNSAFCMCELGGVWLQSKSVIPVVVPPLGFSDLKAVLDGMQVLKIEDPEALDELRDEIAERAAIELHPTPRWNERKAKFLSGLPEVLRGLPDETPVARASHKKLQAQLAEYQSALSEAKNENGRLTALANDLKKVKDATAVATVLKNHAPPGEDGFKDEFEELLGAATSAMAKLGQWEEELLYFYSRGESYYPKNGDEWETASGLVESGFATKASDENSIFVNRNSGRARKAVAALDDLKQWLSHPPEGFDEWYEEEYEDEPDIAVRPFWERHFSRWVGSRRI